MNLNSNVQLDNAENRPSVPPPCIPQRAKTFEDAPTSPPVPPARNTDKSSTITKMPHNNHGGNEIATKTTPPPLPPKPLVSEELNF